MCSARLHTNMKIKLSRKVRHECRSNERERKKMTWKQKRRKNWIVNRRNNDNRMIGANNNTCRYTYTHTRECKLTMRYLLWFFFFIPSSAHTYVLSDARVWLWFTFYNRIIDIYRNSCWFWQEKKKRIDGVPNAILSWSAKCPTRNGFSNLRRIRFALFIWFVFFFCTNAILSAICAVDQQTK